MKYKVPILTVNTYLQKINTRIVCPQTYIQVQDFGLRFISKRFLSTIYRSHVSSILLGHFSDPLFLCANPFEMQEQKLPPKKAKYITGWGNKANPKTAHGYSGGATLALILCADECWAAWFTGEPGFKF